MPLVAQPRPPRPPTAHEVIALVERAREGDVAAFERLIAEHQAKVFTFALAFTSDREQAKDLAQDALVKVYRSLGSFRFQSAFSTWIYSIVKNTWLDAVKSRAGREQSLEQPLGDEELERLEAEASAEERLLAQESRHLMLRAIRQVPEAFRAVLMLADVQGLGYEQIAESLSLPLGTVKSRLKRGRDALRAALFRARGQEEPS